MEDYLQVKVHSILERFMNGDLELENIYYKDRNNQIGPVDMYSFSFEDFKKFKFFVRVESEAEQ